MITYIEILFSNDVGIEELLTNSQSSIQGDKKYTSKPPSNKL